MSNRSKSAAASINKSVAKAAKGPAFKTPRELADALGVELKPPLKANEVQRLRKPLPGYAATLNDAAEMIEQDSEALGFSAGEAEQLLDMQRRYKALRTNETLLETVYLSVYYQRQQLDDQAMGLLQRIARRVLSRAEEDPQLPLRWSILLDFLGAFRKGGRPSTVVEAPPPPANDSEVLATSLRGPERQGASVASWCERPNGSPHKRALVASWCERPNGGPDQRALVASWCERPNGGPDQRALVASCYGRPNGGPLQGALVAPWHVAHVAKQNEVPRFATVPCCTPPARLYRGWAGGRAGGGALAGARVRPRAWFSCSFGQGSAFRRAKGGGGALVIGGPKQRSGAAALMNTTPD